MSKRYGVAMNTYGSVLPGSARIGRIVALSREAKQRLKWIDYYYKHGQNGRLTCRHFGISPDTFYRWKRRYNPKNLSALEDDRSSRTPRQLRQPQTDPKIVKRIKQLRETYPRWGKKKLWKLLEREGYHTSISTVGRTLNRLRARGRLIEPVVVTARLAGYKRRRKSKRPYAVHKPWDYPVKAPGDLVEIDTVHIYPVPGQRRYQFTASDCVAKHTARIAASRITS